MGIDYKFIIKSALVVMAICSIGIIIYQFIDNTYQCRDNTIAKDKFYTLLDKEIIVTCPNTTLNANLSLLGVTYP